SQIDGLRIGSTNAYINTEDISTTSTPLSVVLTQSARVDIYQGKQLLGSSYLGPGIHDIDTNNFPAGAYPVLMKIFQNGKLVRQETQFFENSGQDQPKLGKSQWFFQIGKKRTLSNYDGMMYSSKRNKNETQFSGGVRVGLSSRLSLTSALMG
ncbi:TcfC E-set like domain-containing protein, partial [Salmonella enterica]